MTQGIESPRRLLWPVVTAAAINAAFILAYVAIYHHDLSSLICADQERIGRWPFEEVNVGFPTHGFDGQFYYVLARYPFRPPVQFLDEPAYRNARIVYPAFARLFSAGDPQALFWVLPAINWAALSGIAWLGALLARHYGRSTWWGAALPFILNVTPAALRDLADPVATFAACGIVAAWLLEWPACSFAAICALALLSREQNLVIAGIVFLEAALRRNYRTVISISIAVLIWVAWICWLRQKYDQWPFLAVNSEALFAGLSYRAHHMTGGLSTPDSWIHALAMLTLGLHMILSLWMTASRAQRLFCLISLAGLALAVQGGVSIYLNLESYTRVFWWMPFGVWLWVMQTGRTWPGVLMAGSFFWPCYALAQAAFKVHQGAVTFL